MTISLPFDKIDMRGFLTRTSPFTRKWMFFYPLRSSSFLLTNRVAADVPMIFINLLIINRLRKIPDLPQASITTFCGALLVLFLLSGASAGERLTVSFSFDRPVTESRDDLQAVSIAGLPSVGNPGEPVLPVETAFILLPPGRKLSHISVDTASKVILPGRYQLVWGQPQKPLSASRETPFSAPDEAIYSSSDPFPRHLYRTVGVWSLRGYPIAILNLHPIQYVPTEQTLSYFPRITIHLETEPSAESLTETTRMLRTSRDLEARLSTLIDNPEVLQSYAAIDQSADPAQSHGLTRYEEEEYPLMIVTDQDLASAFQTLADHKSERGLRTKVITTQEIAAGYPGGDLPEQIRNCISEAYMTQQTDFVLLGGDDELIPHRGFCAEAFGYTDDDIPADLYYGALDGSWNDDGDDLWGEPGEEDLLAEVGIGRAPVDDISEAQHFINKVIRYEEWPVLEQTVEALMAGEELFDNPLTWGGDYKDEIKDGSGSHGFTTQGFPPHFSVNTLYDRDLGYTWWGGILRNLMNDGTHLINHAGHTSVTRALRMSADQVLDELTNDGIEQSYFLIYSQGCYAASFDNRNPGGTYGDDCVAEAFLTAEHGAVAFVGNSRYGWAQSGTTDGVSQYFDRQFFDALFGESIHTLGSINDDSKIDNLWAWDYEGVRWCYYDQTLLGDPSMSIWTDIPETLTVVHPEVITIDEHNTFLVVVSSNGIKVPDALVCISGKDDVYVTERTNGGGIAYMAVNPGTPDTLDICVTAANGLPYHGSIMTRAAEPSLWYSQHILDDDKIGDSWGNSNGEINQGEIFELTIWLQNFGSQTAEDISAVLMSADPFVSILDPVREYPDIAPEGQQASDGPFIVSVHNDCPDGHQIVFTVQALMDETPIGISSFSLPVSAPSLVFENAVMDDKPPYGNGNGALEPNESALLMVTIRNNGSYQATTVTGELSAGQDPYIQIERNPSFFSTLESGTATSGWPAYKITASPECPGNYFFDYNLQLTAANRYSTNDSVPGAVGYTGLIDDMEGPASVWKPGELWHLTDRDCHSALSAWYAGLDSASGYPANVDASLTSEPIALLSGSCLSFWHRYDLEENQDFGYVEICDDTGWVCLNGYDTGNSDGWVRESFDLSGYPSGSVIKIRFRLVSDEQNSGEGWFIDDVFVGPPRRFHLDQASVSPERGVESTDFTFSINYISDRNYPPTKARVSIDGTFYPLTTDDNDYTDGAVFSYHTTLGIGQHDYRYEFESGLETMRWPGLEEYDGPLVAQEIYGEDFESDDGGYAITGSVWEWGLPTIGPDQAHSGQRVWATVLDGSYPNDADARLETPTIDLTDIHEPQLSFWHWYYFEDRPARYDGANVKISVDGGDFELVTPAEGYDGTIYNTNAGIPDEPGYSRAGGMYWHEETFDLTPYIDHLVAFRFHFGSNWRYGYPGWYIDDVSVTGLELIPHPVGVCGLRADPHHQDIRLSWSRPKDPLPSGYAIYRGLLTTDSLSEPELIAVVPDTVYLDTRAASDPEVNYYYQVRAVDPDDRPLSPSQPVGAFDVPLRNHLTR